MSNTQEIQMMEREMHDAAIAEQVTEMTLELAIRTFDEIGAKGRKNMTRDDKVMLELLRAKVMDR